MRRRLLVGGPLDGQYIDVRGSQYEIALPSAQWVACTAGEYLPDPLARVPFRRGIYRPKKIAFGADGAHTEIEVMAYYGTNADEGR